MTDQPVVISRDQQEELDPLLGKMALVYGEIPAALLLEAYILGRRHGMGPEPVASTACAIMGLVSGGLITEEISKREKRQ